MKIVNIVGARPNFMKIAPLVEEMKKHKEIKQLLVHTGQHYDRNMSKLFFIDLGLPKPDIELGVGSGSHAEQTAKILIEFERVLVREKPDVVLVVGDVNSTIACALASVKLNIPVVHVEAGLRSFDRTMPEEINRVLTDSISDSLFITETDARTNLLREGISEKKIFFVGNVMIDTLLKHIHYADRTTIISDLNLIPHEYAVLTLHRPSNVDNPKVFGRILDFIYEIQRQTKIVYSVHPRTKRKIKEYGLQKKYSFLRKKAPCSANFLMIDPLGYIDFLQLIKNAKFVMTDSGGIQEETTVLGIPCLTLRENTERPVTVSSGTNIITGLNKNKVIREYRKIILGKNKKPAIPKYWDGKAAKRIVSVLLRKYKNNG